ncbi:transposase, putative [Trichomonas vaginalis G3]|uniref:Transposase, putative n=1 Tax=Trichomonas vaginalis (strain ATCC PRA-98 / G3) TaxID=412133 RepID=A2DR35_TRIV3|nr:jerky protein homolog-like [Trichomonas vaginalis G3]EAY17134.1 transposase, putative [Trichomonas vaginalis G3]KAI5508849.1 jerky protein homolog-like [Trichomonas vaginalis G3]|eukprot:XP_001329357.1 transposase [Trichomonas vaginalis G3]
MLLSNRIHTDPDLESTFAFNYFKFVKTPKGYQTQASMIEWIKQVLIPYVNIVRTDSQIEQSPLVLVMDGLSTHFNDIVRNALQPIEPFILVALPPHSSHRSQPLDNVCFATMKNAFKNIKPRKDLTDFSAKIVRIKEAIDRSFTNENIIKSWENCGFNITYFKGFIVKVSWDESFGMTLLNYANHTHENNEAV